jgi:alkanesulfonate monooxygenase
MARGSVGGVPDFAGYTAFCRLAEHCGIESVLMPFGFHRPDPTALSAALGAVTERIKFLVAMRSAAMTPTYFVQQVNTLSALTNGRVIVNIVAGLNPEEHEYYGDFLSHDERYERTDEFLTICNALWREETPLDFSGSYYRVRGARLRTPFVSPDRATPEVFISGNSEWSDRLTAAQGTCQLRLADTPARMKAPVRRVLESGVEAGILVSLVARPTREEAVAAAYGAIEGLGEQPRRAQEELRSSTDSVSFGSVYEHAHNDSAWLTPYLWTGAVPYMGAPSIALVGSADEVTDALFEYREIGVTHFLSLGWPDEGEMRFFAREILPRIRERERREGRVVPTGCAAPHGMW